MSLIEAALAAIESLEPGESINYTNIAKSFGIHRTTLMRRHQGVSTSRTIQAENNQSLTPQQEQELVRYIGRLTDRGLPPTKEMIRNFGSQIAKKELGVHWADRFIQRHAEQLAFKWTTGMDNSRHKADSESKYSLYFSLLADKIQQYDIQPCNSYNMDEKGFMIGIVGRSKRIFSKASYEAGGRRSLIQDGNREWITLLACICADGSYLEPGLIYQSVSSSIQDTWLQAFNPEIHRALFTSSPSGWTNNDIGLAWLKQVFNRYTKTKAGRSYRLLILDGHGSHITMDFIEFCNRNRILLAIYPPHSTHTLQPLDVVLFKPLSTAYSNEVSAFMERSQGLTSMSKRDFFPLFYTAWEAVFKESTILKAFKATGLSPFDPQVILRRFNPIVESSSDSDSSALSASDWRKIEGLLRQVVENRDDRRVKRLSQALHTSSVQNAVQKHEIEMLRAALINERTRRKRGKALPLKAPKKYHGGAVFWSPKKVKEARDRQQQKELEEKQLQQQKLQTNQLRQEARQAKAKAIQTRREARAEARLLREKERAARAADQAARKAARRTAKRLQQTLKSSQKGRKKGVKATITATPRKTAVVEHEDSREASGAAAGATPILSRRGRAINTPKRFL